MFGLTGIEAARTCSVGRRESSDPFVFGNQGEGKGVMDWVAEMRRGRKDMKMSKTVHGHASRVVLRQLRLIVG